MKKQQLTEKEMMEFINSNLNLIPKRTVGKFDEYDLNTKYRKMVWWKKNSERKMNEKNENVYVIKVKRILENKSITIEDVIEIINYCNKHIETIKSSKLEEIEKEIQRLNELKETLK